MSISPLFRWPNSVNHFNAGAQELKTFHEKGNEVRVKLFEVSAMRNEVLTKDEIDNFMDVVTQGTIRAVTRLKVDKEHCGHLAATIYESDRKNNPLAKIFNSTAMIPSQVDEFYLTLASYSEATCNAYLTKDK